MSGVNYAKLAEERFTGTRLHGFDQITAVSQGAVRRQMKLMHKLAEENSPIRRFYTETTEDDDWTCIKGAELGPSSVELLLHGDNKQTVLFTLNLKSGIFQYLGGKKAKPTQETAIIQDWRLVFRVRLNLAVLSRDNIPSFIQRVLIKPDDYSVHQLIVNFTTAEISTYNKVLSHIALPTDSAKRSFTDHIESYLTKLTNETGNFHSTIHYLPTIKKPENYHAPKIVPTSLTFQNLPFVTSESADGINGDDKNMLLYLQMTENKSSPHDLLPWPQANWVVPPTGTDPYYDGTACLSKGAFLDGWLLPRLARFNRATTWVLKSIKHDPNVSPLPFNIDAHMGYTDDELPEKGTPWVYNNNLSTPSTFHYTYGKERVDSRITCHGPKGEFCQQDTGVWNDLEIPVGLNVEGKSVIKIYGRVEVWSWASQPAWCVSTAYWNSTLTFDGVDHGRLKIKVDFPPPKVVQQNGVTWHDKYGTKYDKVIAAGVKKLGALASALQEEISGLLGGDEALWSFIFGGNDDFFIDKAAFNSEGDLLAQLVYKLKE